jgi:hypothetical protein
MKRGNPVTRLLILAGCAALAVAIGARAGTPARIDLWLLYAGHPGSVREQDFVAFLTQHFSRVGTGDLTQFTPGSAVGYDVVLMDYDIEGLAAFETKLPALPLDYSKPTVTIGVAGGLLCSKLALKTGYA